MLCNNLPIYECLLLIFEKNARLIESLLMIIILMQDIYK